MPDLDITRLTDARDRVRRLDGQLSELRAQRDANEKALLQARRSIAAVERELIAVEGEIVSLVTGRPPRTIEGYRQPKDEG